MGRQANSVERELASMSFCPQCGLELPEGSSFCYKCGTHVGEEEPTAPHLEAERTPPQLVLAGAGDIPRLTPRGANEPTCRFCKGPLDLGGEFCEQCGAPVSDAAPSRWLKSVAVAHPVVSQEGSPKVVSAARLTGPSATKAPSPPAKPSYASSPSVLPRSKGESLDGAPTEHATSATGRSAKIAGQEGKQSRYDLGGTTVSARSGNFGPKRSPRRRRLLSP